MMELDFTKMTGAGNDFIVLEGDDAKPIPDSRDIIRLCDRKYGIGADGLMVFRAGSTTGGDSEPGSEAGSVPADGVPADGATESAFEVDFFNSDGSTGMLCGNGARCILEYARNTGRISAGRRVGFLFAGRAYSGESLGIGRSRFFLSRRYEMGGKEIVRTEGVDCRGRLVDVESLHFIVDIDDIISPGGKAGYGTLEEIPVVDLGRRIRHHPRFAPTGVNVSFTRMVDGRLHIRTFERGVEDETLACGMGSTSACLVRWVEGEARPPITVITRSGEELLVDFMPEAYRASGISLSGPSCVVYTGRIRLD
jgi:diaminopimelate epimerase